VLLFLLWVEIARAPLFSRISLFNVFCVGSLFLSHFVYLKEININLIGNDMDRFLPLEEF
jgi:hypothetical protein